MATAVRKAARKSARKKAAKPAANSAVKAGAAKRAQKPAKSAGKAAARAPARAGAGGASRDYLLVSRNRRLVVFHGNSGESHELDPQDTAKVLRLLKQRQKHAKQITTHLKKRGFSVATARIIDSNEGSN